MQTLLLTNISGDWKQYRFTLVPVKSDPLAKLVILFNGHGQFWLDQVSLIPGDAEGGVRRDVEQKVAALHPAFIRWPGGTSRRIITGSGVSARAISARCGSTLPGVTNSSRAISARTSLSNSPGELEPSPPLLLMSKVAAQLADEAAGMGRILQRISAVKIWRDSRRQRQLAAVSCEVLGDRE